MARLSDQATQQDHANESLRLELQETILTYRHWAALLIQIAGFIIAGAVVLISYGFTQKLAAIRLLAVFAPILILLTYQQIGSLIAPLVDLIQSIENRLRIPEKDSLGATIAQVHRRSMSEKDRKRYTYWSRVPIILYVATVALIGLFVLSLTVYHYRFM